MFWIIDTSLETLLHHLPPEAQPPMRRLAATPAERCVGLPQQRECLLRKRVGLCQH